MRTMYELMQEKGKISKECAAFLTATLMVVMISLLTTAVITLAGLWGYADTILSLAVLVSGLGSLIWILNL